MKKMDLVIAFFVVAGISSPLLYAGEGHEHEHEAAGGPKGGRLLENTEPQAEFYVEKDKSIIVTFYDHDLKQVPVADQSVLIIAGKGENKSQIEFKKKGDVLVSKTKLPESAEIDLVVQLKQGPNSRQQNFRIAYEDKICGVCNRAEYACVCGH